ncbi:MAG: YqgE/AlgH family protein [Chitinophagaceae bacterium]|nr:YqgE/AlgH family protein [Chitinophagaceae bacterium]
MTALKSGILLISDPFLKDPNFLRTVVFLCEHQEQGSFGFIVNKPIDLTLQDVIQDAEGLLIPLSEGGPVQKDTLHFLHRRPDLIEGGIEVIDHIFWSGDFAQTLALLHSGELPPSDIRFFIGYSGWGESQLQQEVDDKSWITGIAKNQLIFNSDIPAIWKESLNELGGEYRQMVNYPIDPQLN